MNIISLSLAAHLKELSGDDAFMTGLLKYLEGYQDIDRKWFKQVSSIRSEEQPAAVYRTVLVSSKLVKGDKLSFKAKPLVSAATTAKASLYACCSYAHDYNKPVARKVLLTVELYRPTVILHLKDLRWLLNPVHSSDKIRARYGNNQLPLGRLKNEKECIIQGTHLSGTVVAVNDPVVLIQGRTFKSLAS